MIGWYNGWSPAERLATVPVQRTAIRNGTLAQPRACSICGSEQQVWLHDEDYAQPLKAYAVCRACHRALHERFDAPVAWTHLVTHHADGSRWFERLTLDPASRYRPFVETYPDGLPPR